MKDDFIKENIRINRKMVLWSCDHKNNISLTYSNFMTTLAGLFLTLSPLILAEITKNGLFVKVLFAVGFFLIFLSLIFGGVYILLKRNFFSKWMDIYSSIFSKWNNCKKEEDEKDVLSFEECMHSLNRTSSPQWPVLMQTVLLFLGISIEVLVFIIIIFI